MPQVRKVSKNRRQRLCLYFPGEELTLETAPVPSCGGGPDKGKQAREEAVLVPEGTGRGGSIALGTSRAREQAQSGYSGVEPTPSCQSWFGAFRICRRLALEAGWGVALDLFSLLDFLPARHWICYFQGNRAPETLSLSPSPLASGNTLGSIYLFICSFRTLPPHLSH